MYVGPCVYKNQTYIFIFLFLRSPDGEEGKIDLPNAKVVSILGNTGEGKSYALNRTFFARDDEQRDGSSFQEVIIMSICLFILLQTFEGMLGMILYFIHSLLQVFSTSPSPDSCTMGVWAAYDPRLQLIILDTEGNIS